MMKEFDVLVVGGGPAGYSAAIHAARSGKSRGITVGLVEMRQLGGTCLNRGCIPTKTLLETARFLDLAGEASRRGVEFGSEPTLDLAKAFQFKNRIVRRMSAGIGVLLRENGIEMIDGRASVDRDATGASASSAGFVVSVTKTDGKVDDFRAKKLILAAGSKPSTVSVEGLDRAEVSDRVWDSDSILDGDASMQTVPKRLAILGGGVIGVEMARIFKSFGSDVHVIEALPRLIPFLDVELSQALTKSLKAKKIELSLGKKLRRVEAAEDGLALFLDCGETLSVSHLLLAVGRMPVTDLLSDSLREELKPDARRFLPVNWKMETPISGLFAPGDVNGRCMLAHAAVEMGRLAAETAVEQLYPEMDETDGNAQETELEEYRRRIMFKDGEPPLPDLLEGFFPFYVPGCIYGEPEIGYIGWTEEQAREKLGDRLRVGRFPFAANGRAASSGHLDGFVKVLALEGEQRIVGVHMIGPCVSELINEVSAVMYAGGNADQWAASVHAHPTYGEALVEAAADAFGSALHLPPKSR